MFIVKKITSSFILPPGIFIVILFVLGAILVIKKYRKIGGSIFSIAVFMWLFSIAPTADILLSNLESGFYQDGGVKGDVIILLGGALFEKVPDLSGTGFPDGDMLGRIVTSVRLQKRMQIPVIVSFGRVIEEREPGAPVIKRFLADLGVPEDQIILENESRDTYENAKFSMEICRKMGFDSPILLTSAYHLKRAYWVSKHLGMDVDPFPAFFMTQKHPGYSWYSLLPSGDNFARVSMALHEILGLFFYKHYY
ncbi:MAG: YdcF family protein [Desulfobacteraceae bacterium]|nr:MAG: YdcF family protein [Desulfobacteraceae bacterium]